jgi:hypothetical protein
MSINVGKYTFEGPYSSTESLEDKSGIYLVVCHSGGKYHPVDVGESGTVKSRVKNHDRKSCWNRNCNSSLEVAVLYTPNMQQAGRGKIEEEIRGMYDFPCGEM